MISEGDAVGDRPIAYADVVRHRLTTAARAALSWGDRLDRNVIVDVCVQAGVSVNGLRRLFPTDLELLESVHQELVRESADRLRVAVEQFVPPGDQSGFSRAAELLAAARPLDRGGVALRAQWRARAFTSSEWGAAFLRAERGYLRALSEILVELLVKLERRFVPSPGLGSRVVLDTFELSFSAWILDGRDELDFPLSPYVRASLPALLDQMSAPVPR